MQRIWPGTAVQTVPGIVDDPETRVVACKERCLNLFYDPTQVLPFGSSRMRRRSRRQVRSDTQLYMLTAELYIRNTKVYRGSRLGHSSTRVRFGSLADYWTDSRSMSASGGKADVKTSEFRKIEGPLSARTRRLGKARFSGR